jgi:MoaA/NifB/PqqE/SkfB family radical SAM enzyme
MNVSGGMALRILSKGIWNTFRNNPLSVSFEITHSCTANCWHCNWGGQVQETRRTPAEYAAINRELKPMIVNVSGGEPMARKDLDDIVRAFSRPGRLPWIVVISNASQLDPDRFRRLKAAGMHQLSLSIDFPDDRHSAFRRIPGLFARMDEMVPKCVAIGETDDISLNCCITAWNYRDLPDIVRLAHRWGVSVNFSAYSTLRMDDPRGLVRNNGSPDELREKIAEVIEMKRQGYPVYTSDRVMWKFADFLVQGRAPGCRAGYKFLVVAPDGRLTPCATVMAYFDDHRAMQREFSDHNACEACFISTRANTEKRFGEFMADNAETLRQWLPWSRSARPRLARAVAADTAGVTP